jgi:dihydroorotase
VLTDSALLGFDSQYKVKPPLRTQEDVDALIEGLKDGTIDVIVSQHTPHEIEFKNVEFEMAEYGIIGFQTALPLALRSGLPLELIVEKMAINPRRILNVEAVSLNEGNKANLVVIDPEKEWVFERSVNRSRSFNSPFIDEKLKGSILLSYNNNQLFKS